MKAMEDTEEQMVKEVGRSAFGSSSRVAKCLIFASGRPALPRPPRPVLMTRNPEVKWREASVSTIKRLMAL